MQRLLSFGELINSECDPYEASPLMESAFSTQRYRYDAHIAAVDHTVRKLSFRSLCLQHQTSFLTFLMCHSENFMIKT